MCAATRVVQAAMTASGRPQPLSPPMARSLKWTELHFDSLVRLWLEVGLGCGYASGPCCRQTGREPNDLHRVSSRLPVNAQPLGLLQTPCIPSHMKPSPLCGTRCGKPAAGFNHPQLVRHAAGDDPERLQYLSELLDRAAELGLRVARTWAHFEGGTGAAAHLRPLRAPHPHLPAHSPTQPPPHHHHTHTHTPHPCGDAHVQLRIKSCQMST